MNTETYLEVHSHELERFLELAYRGRSECSSTGEQAARKLAQTIIECVPQLNERLLVNRVLPGQKDGLFGVGTLEGLKQFVDLVAKNPDSARRVIG